MIRRRELLRCLFGMVAARRSACPLEVERIVRDHPLPATAVQTGSYRADATVLFLGMTILRRKNVGGGSIHFEEAQSDTAKRFAITFKAGSLRERAGGLNRLGYIQEVCVESKSTLREAAYFGIMTSSPEESFADAKGALEKESKDGVRYTAIDGVNSAGRARSASHRWIFPPEYDWSRCDAIVSIARERTKSAEPNWRQIEANASGTPHTFLYIVLRALRDPAKRSEFEYVFGPERFRLTTEKSLETKDTTRLKGEILNQATGKKTNFNVYFHPGATLPARIEFQPRSYLRLSFEAV